MLVVALVSTKGGVGKSCLAECLAVEAVRVGRSTFIVDLDAQQSTAAWWRRRLGPENPMLITGRGSAIRAMREVQTRREDRDVAILDTPGSDMGTIHDAMVAADCIVAVVRPSVKDLEAQGAMTDLIEKTGTASRVLYVINGAIGQSNLGRFAVELMRDRSPHEPLIVAQRTDYIRADAEGKVGNEINKQAEAEISAIWAAIERIGNEHRQPA